MFLYQTRERQWGLDRGEELDWAEVQRENLIWAEGGWTGCDNDGEYWAGEDIILTITVMFEQPRC